MKNVLISIAVAVIIAFVGFLFIRWAPHWTPTGYTDAAIIYLAVVVGGGCCWIGLNLRNK
jgi:hypothetical protein